MNKKSKRLLLAFIVSIGIFLAGTVGLFVYKGSQASSEIRDKDYMREGPSTGIPMVFYGREDSKELTEQTDFPNQKPSAFPPRIDTVWHLADGRSIILSGIGRVAIHEYLPDFAYLDSMDRIYDNRFEAALAYERHVASHYGERFKRDSSGLYVRLRNGKWKKLYPDESLDETGHTFEYYFPTFGYYSIRTQWGEGNGYKLINEHTGEVTRIIGRPYFSPDGAYVLAVSSDLEAGYSANGFQLLENKHGHLRLLLSQEYENRGIVRAQWKDDSTAVLLWEMPWYANDVERKRFYGLLRVHEK